jgi:signal transduction histidine kinase
VSAGLVESRVFVLAPSGKDAALVGASLQRSSLGVKLCLNAHEVLEHGRDGIGSLILAEEALHDAAGLRLLQGMIEQQPSWSDLPVLLLTSSGRLSPLAARALQLLGNVTMIQRPTQVATLVSAVRTALRTRQRQYEMRQADVRKDMFLATLAHELRNPLAPLSNALHLLQELGLPDPQLQWALGVMQRQTGQLTRLVDDLLDVARITRDKITLQKEALDLRDPVHAAIETSLPQIEAMGHDFTVELPPQPVWIHADRTRITQCVSNLLTNAAKYTPRNGRITLSVASNAQGVFIRVRDNGIGFRPQDAHRLFEVFAQVDHAVPRAQGGLGLGLSIVRAMAELHDGAVWATSAGEGRGSEFTLRLPLAEAPTTAAAQPGPGAVEAGSCCRVLVVDDNADSADSMAELLTRCGHDTRTAYSGRQALSLVANWTPQLALLDIGLPDMSGHELARRIRSSHPGQSLMLVALTGWGQATDVARSSEAGFAHHLTKPANLERLLALVDEAARALSHG